MRSTSGPGKADRPVTPVLLFGLVGGYIVLQSAWWAWLLISKDRDVHALQAQLLAEGADPAVPVQDPDRTLWMIAGEGGVFLVLLLLALWLIFRTVKHELGLARQQRDFLLAASHELRTPIAGLKLHLQTLQRSGLDAAQREDLTGHVRADVERLHALTEKILLATRLDEPHIPLERSRVDLVALLRAVVANAAASYARGHDVRLEVPEEAIVDTDADAFSSVVVNLLENACKYAPTGTVVEIILERREHMWELCVADMGPGVPETERALIFRKFHRGSPEETRGSKGTGLGLYIVQRLMRGLGGRVEHRPRPGGGSIFAASFPHR
jgi:two-component system phosphate regulon sensor histidine kinase PhoR